MTGKYPPTRLSQGMVFLKILVIFNMLLKINYFLRVYERFGLLVNLLSTCVKDIIPFCVYLFMYVLLFVMLYIQSGINAPGRTGFKVRGFGEMLMYVWENSIGNINDPPESSFHLDNNKTEGLRYPSEMYLIWFVWFMNQFIIVIILLNFLIAVISQSYENVMNSKSIMKYQDMAALNKEAYQFMNHWGFKHPLIKKNRLLVSLEVANDEGETSEWSGFVQTMKIFVKKQLQENQGKLIDFFKEKNAGLRHVVTSMQSTVKTDINEVKSEMRSMKNKVLAIETLVKKIAENTAKD